MNLLVSTLHKYSHLIKSRGVIASNLKTWYTKKPLKSCTIPSSEKRKPRPRNVFSVIESVVTTYTYSSWCELSLLPLFTGGWNFWKIIEVWETKIFRGGWGKKCFSLIMYGFCNMLFTQQVVHLKCLFFFWVLLILEIVTISVVLVF